MIITAMRITVGRTLQGMLLSALLPLPAVAQDGFLFRMPHVTLSLRAGAAAPEAKGELYKFLTDELTLEKRDFQSATYGGDVGVRLTPRIDLQLSAFHARSENNSEFRDWTDMDDRPIEQVTTLRRTPVSAALKFHFRERGRSLGRYAWVPVDFQPYVGVGAGVIFYDLKQSGDFVDHETLDVFTDHFESSGNAPMLQAMAGTDWWASNHLGLTLEGRYSWGSADLRDHFRDFGSIDLNGFQLTAGLAVRF